MRHGQIVFTGVAPPSSPLSSLAQQGMGTKSMLAFRIMSNVITCKARHDQIDFTGVAPQSSLAQQGMAKMRMLVITLAHYLQGKTLPD